jgi:hypothetical protein
MAKNTFVVVIILAIVAALLVGVNVGKKLTISQDFAPTITASPTPLVTPPPGEVYTSTTCGIMFNYPATLRKMENTSGSAVFTDSATAKEAFAVTCQSDIPRPALDASKIETLRIVNGEATVSVSAKLYHDASAEDGTPIDILMWRVPNTTLDVYLAGYGETFNQILQTLRLYP